MEPTRTVAYLRVSTDKQADHGLSLDAQREKALAYADLYDLHLVEVITDAGASAKTLFRPGLQRALAKLRANEAEAILVVKLDRLTRSVHDLGVLLDEYFTHPRFALLSVSENIDTRSAGGRLVLNVLASVAQWEREAIGERTKAALGVKRHRGQYTGGRPPYGWRLGTDGTTLDPDPAEQAVIAEAGNLRERGWSLRRIAVELDRRGMRSRSGTPLSLSAVHRMVTSG
jgi:site-specific DNA recombinase